MDDGSSNGEWPQLLQYFIKEGRHPEPSFSYVISALFLCANYLHRCCVASLLMSQRKFYLIDNIDRERDQLVPYLSEQLDETPTKQSLVLDAVTLKNLDVLPDPSNPTMNSLFQYIDHTVTPFGKRLLKAWLCEPLYRIDLINRYISASSFIVDD